MQRGVYQNVNHSRTFQSIGDIFAFPQGMEYRFELIFFFWLHRMWDPSFLTRDETHVPYIGSAES